MVPIRGEWTPFTDSQDQLEHFRRWGLIPPKSEKIRPVMVTDGCFGAPEPCKVVGYQTDDWAVIELEDGCHAIHGEYLAELQPSANQKLPYGTCFSEILSQYVVIDIETTGFDLHRDRIIEIAAIRYKYGEKIGEFQTLVAPGVLIPPDITRLTGITQDDVSHAPALGEVENEFFHFIGDSPLVGHNALTFDVPFLSAQFSRKIENYVFDTLILARRVFDLLPRHKLEYLNDVFHLGSAGSHRALNDVETTNALLWACLAPRKYEALAFKAFLDHRLRGEKAIPKCRTVRKTSSTKPSSASTPPEKSVAISKSHKFMNVDIKSIVPTCDTFDQNNPLCGKSIVFTGELTIPREKAMQIAVNCGATLKSSVSGKTHYLVVGKQDITIVGTDGMSSKEEKAHALNKAGKAHIQIITEKEFLDLAQKEGTTV